MNHKPYEPLWQRLGVAQRDDLPDRLSLCNDVVFKTLFSKQLGLLSDLINAVRYGLPPIVVRRILNPSILPADLTGKEIVLDLLAEDTEGRRVAIEMQLRRFRHWPERSVYGLARNLAGQLRVGQDYRQLKPSIGISLLAHDLFVEYPDQAAWRFTLRDETRPEIELGDALQLHIIELRKAERLRIQPEPLRAWITCLLHNRDEAVMNTISHPPVREALEHLRHLYSDEEFRLLVERREQGLVDAQDMLDYARHDGEQKGLRKGLQKGLQKGASDVLEQLLARKFGPLSADVIKRLRQAETGQLQAWSLKLLEAETLDQVFS